MQRCARDAYREESDTLPILYSCKDKANNCKGCKDWEYGLYIVAEKKGSRLDTAFNIILAILQAKSASHVSKSILQTWQA